MQTAVEIVQGQCYFWQYLVCFLLYFLLPSSLHSIIYFSSETEECTQSHFSATLQPVERVGSLCMQHPGKCAFSWSDLVKSTYLYSCSSLLSQLLHCSQSLKCLVSNTPWDLHFICQRNATCYSYPVNPKEQGHWRWLCVLIMLFGVCC